MRNHAGFVVTVAAALLTLGSVFIAIGVAQAQTDSVSGAGLQTWGNQWFLLGLFIVIIGAVALVISIAMYFRWLHWDPKARFMPGKS
jgi:hypothetical protein